MKKRHFLTLILAGILLGGTSAIAGETSLPTQRQWMVNLVTAMGWSFGLPDTPDDTAYLDILSGRRRLRIEAEQTFQESDVVSVKQFKTFGDYSGEGWLSGLASSTSAQLRFLLPLGGNYRVSVALRRPGHRILIDNQTFNVDGGQEFSLIELGRIDLAAGEHEVRIQLPPDGGIDYLELEAPDLSSIAPIAGWNLDQPVSLDTLAVTAIQVLGLESLLPPGSGRDIIEAERADDIGSAQRTEVRHLGEPSGGSWVRAATTPATVQLGFNVPNQGVYTLALRCTAEKPITALLNDQKLLEAPASTFLQNLPLGSVFLPQGKNTLTLTLPPRGGVDFLEIAARRSDGPDYRRLIGLPATGTYPTAAEVDHLLALLVAVGAHR